jgi:outer membrane protein
LRADSVLKVAQQTVSSRQTIRDKVNALFQNNLKSGLDASFADVNLADSQLFLAQAQNDLKSAEAVLATAIGMPAQAEFSLTDEPMGDALPPQADPLIQQAVQDRPELKDLRLQQGAAERFAQAEHALNYPTIAAVGAVGIVPAGEGAVPGRYGAAGVNVNIPILNGGLYRARQSEAELKAKAATERVRDETNLIIRDVRTAYLNASTAFQRVDLTNQLLTQATRALDLAQGRYDLGLSSIVELSEAQLNLTSAQIAHATAQYDYQSQRLFVDYQTGALR